jgi:hypothetical protein
MSKENLYKREQCCSEVSGKSKLFGKLWRKANLAMPQRGNCDFDMYGCSIRSRKYAGLSEGDAHVINAEGRASDDLFVL